MNCKKSLEKTGRTLCGVIRTTGRMVDIDWTAHLGQGLREGDADTSFLHLLLEVFDAILAIIIICSYGAHPRPAKM